MKIEVRWVVSLLLVVSVALPVLCTSLSYGDGASLTEVSVSHASSFEVQSVCLQRTFYSIDSPYDEVTFTMGTLLYANDSALKWENRVGDDNETWWVDSSAGTFERIVSSMEREDYWSKDDRYEDSGYESISSHAYTLRASGSGSEKSVVFTENAVIGLMPETFRLMKLVGYEYVVIDLSVTMLLDREYEVSLVVTNTGTRTITVSYPPGAWVYYVVRSDGLTCDFLDTRYDCDVDVEPGETKDFSTMVFDASSLSSGLYRYWVPFYGSGAYFNIDVEGYYHVPVPGQSSSAIVFVVAVAAAAAVISVVVLFSRTKRPARP